MPEKYSKDAPFEDPILRCDSCAKILTRESLHKVGRCRFCGNRKVRNVQTMTGEEMRHLQAAGVDDDFLSLFEQVAA